MASLVPIRPQTSMILQVTPEALPKFHMWTQFSSQFDHKHPQFVRLCQRRCPNSIGKWCKWHVSSQFNHEYPQFFRSCRRRCPNSTGGRNYWQVSFHNSSCYAGGATQIPQANPINDKFCPNSTTNNQDSLGYAGIAAQIPHVNAINDKSRSNSSTNIHASAGYAGGVA